MQPIGPALRAFQYLYAKENGRGASVLSLDDIRSLFQQHGLRCTRQRELVYGALAATHAHPTAEEIFQTIRATDDGLDGLSLATVYNALDAFVQVGLARQVPTHGPARYDADTSPHAHLSTPQGDVVDVPEDISERLLGAIPSDVVHELERRLGVKVSRVLLQVVTQPATGEPSPPKF